MDEKTFAGGAAVPGLTRDPSALGAGLMRGAEWRARPYEAIDVDRSVTASELNSKSTGRMQHAFQELLAMTEALDKVLLTLAARLEPVMAAGAPEVGRERGPGPRNVSESSGLTNAVIQVTEHLVALRARIEYMLQRIEL